MPCTPPVISPAAKSPSTCSPEAVSTRPPPSILTPPSVADRPSVTGITSMSLSSMRTRQLLPRRSPGPSPYVLTASTIEARDGAPSMPAMSSEPVTRLAVPSASSASIRPRRTSGSRATSEKEAASHSTLPGASRSASTTASLSCSLTTRPPEASTRMKRSGWKGHTAKPARPAVPMVSEK